MRVDVVGETVCALVTAAALADSGCQVSLYLPDSPVAQAILRGEPCPYAEPDLEAMSGAQRAAGRLNYLPIEDFSGEASLTFLSLQAGDTELAEGVAALLARHAPPSSVLVNQSAFAVGASETLQSVLGENKHVVAFPDVLQDGCALENFCRPNHIILGCDRPEAEVLVRDVLRPFNRRKDVVQVMGLREAEFAKLAISGMLATRLSFMNDMAGLADRLCVDIEKIRNAMAADPRIGDAYLYPGCGFGGPGFSRDVMRLTDSLKGSDLNAELLERVLEINERQKEVLFRKFWRHFSADVRGKRVTLWGVSFKPGTNRIQNAPSLNLINALLAQDVEVALHDPMALEAVREWLGERADSVSFYSDPVDAVSGSDALMLVTEWKCYWAPDWLNVRRAMRGNIVLDGRNIYNPARLKEQGFVYYGVGRS